MGTRELVISSPQWLIYSPQANNPRSFPLCSVPPSVYNGGMKPFPINNKLVWDYDIPEDAQTNEAFREWYVKRVLTLGNRS